MPATGKQSRLTAAQTRRAGAAKRRGRRAEGGDAAEQRDVPDNYDLQVWNKVRSLETVKDGANYAVGPAFASSLVDDPKHLLFTLARYKFAAKMLGDNNTQEVLEVGCSEGYGTLLLAQAAKRVVGVDFDQSAIAWAKKYNPANVSFLCGDFRKARVGIFDAVVSIDVIEHVSAKYERDFVTNICRHLKPNGFCIIGTPNVTASAHASAFSEVGHINLFDATRLRRLFQGSFENVFLFGMNDEVLHTGHTSMCHYLFVLCCGKKS